MRGSGITARYNKLAERCWILALGGGASRLYTMSTPETQKSQNQGDRIHPTKVWEKLRERERIKGHVPPLHESVPISRGTFKIAYASKCHRRMVGRIRPVDPCVGRWNTWYSTEGQCLRWTQKPRNQSGIVRLTKVGEKPRKKCCQGGRSEGPVQLLHEPVPRLRGTFKVSYASNWHRSHVQRACLKELNPCAERWSIEALHKDNARVRLGSCAIREAEFTWQK
jgi:hypothetical protein